MEGRRSKRLSSVDSSSSFDLPSPLGSPLGSLSSAVSIELFPPTCFICNLQRRQKNKKDELTQKLVTYDAENTIKSAAKDKMPEFYIANKDEDLIAKELQYHQSCYRSFTRGFSQNYREGASKEPESREITEETNTGNFESVKEYIRRHIFELKQAVSMTTLHRIYGLNVDDTRYISKLKTRILREFSDRLTFFTVHAHKPEIVFDSTLPAHEIDFQNKNGCIMKAADYLREEILQYRDNLPELSWPPQIEDLQSDNRKPPENLLRFLLILMQADQSNTNSKHKPND